MIVVSLAYTEHLLASNIQRDTHKKHCAEVGLSSNCKYLMIKTMSYEVFNLVEALCHSKLCAASCLKTYFTDVKQAEYLWVIVTYSREYTGKRTG